MPHRQEKPRLNKGQYYELQAQYERTPNPRPTHARALAQAVSITR